MADWLFFPATFTYQFYGNGYGSDADSGFAVY